ncbi:SMP-30/gluconolactonase/LRE family protein [Piscinibacter gummiphilus]|uniref:SMP-30/Gluconolactonase/LRE-like region domain-containing protein n=1 Tax=Piscinibacter gummiphilus TaxID=946333 RepID=A0A1W6LBC1_9BURK|nr:L-dopachrome tautomerase-related protein [Piscinibacter gummiphilus]ARN21581.1 hypothetical protein A4W93_17685 [Piscinibacter gummiphilus]ATU66265.1 hypothetical protein CPZ87_17770 [Piscinibacter gummiphilus]
MKLRLLPWLAAASMALAATAHAQPAFERWRAYTGVTWHTDGTAPFSGSVTAPIAGLHFDAAGQAYVSTPRVLSAGSPATLSRLDTSRTEGPARLTAFPSTQGNDVAADPATSLRSVLGFHVDHRNGWLWALDMGWVAGEKEAPAGAQKLAVYDLRSGRLLKHIGLDGVADRAGSFLNDVVVDEVRRVAYVSDSGLRSAPDNRVGILVVDYATGTARRVLDGHPSVQVEPGVKVTVRGAEVWPGNPLRLGINGIGLSPDGATLYWTVTTGTRLHALPTRLLRDPEVSAPTLAAAVRDLGAVGGNTDGIVTDARGRLYITDVTRNGIASFDPKAKRLTLLANDDRVHWPDTPAIGPGGDLYVTASALNDHFAGAVRAGSERYEIWRLRLPR